MLKTPSVAQHVAAAKIATEQAERRWTAEAYAAQQQVLIQLARHGFSIRPDYTYARVLDGFSAKLDPRAIALLEHNPEVAGVYPVRIAYPSAVATSTATGVGAGVVLPRFDGAGLRIALLDTGVDLGHPYLGGRVEPGIDLVTKTADARAQPNPQNPTQIERRNRARRCSCRLGWAARPARVAPGASVLPIESQAGRRRNREGRVFARSDRSSPASITPWTEQRRRHDAKSRIALLGVAVPLRRSPTAEARASSAAALDPWSSFPAGNDGAAGPLFGSIAGPGGTASALVVGATDARPSTSTSRVVFHQGAQVLADTTLPLLGTVVPDPTLKLTVGLPGVSGALRGKALLAPAPTQPRQFRRRDGRATAAAYSTAGASAGSLTTAAVPVLGVPEHGGPVVAACDAHLGPRDR